MVNLSELFPEDLKVESSVGVVELPGRMPLRFPHVPAISAAESKPTHLITPAEAQRCSKVTDPPELAGVVNVKSAPVPRFPAASLERARKWYCRAGRSPVIEFECEVVREETSVDMVP